MVPYYGDFEEDATVYIMFNTFSSDDPSASVTITDLLDTDVHIHKNDGLVQRNNAAGITVSTDFDGITGSHMIVIDTNDNTVAGFWVAGADYLVRIEGTTVDGAIINAVIGHFSIENRFTITANAIADQVCDEVLSGHQIQGTVGAAITMSAYMGSRGMGIYLDDSAANTNTILGEDGTAENPVSTIAAAKTISDNLGIKRIYLINNSSITLSATMENFEFVGIGEIAANAINLGSQDVDRSYFINVILSGVQGGTTRIMAHRAALSILTNLEIMAWECAIVNDLTVRQDSFFDKCWSAVAGNATPVLDINSVADVNISWRHYSGGVQIENAVATTTISYESDGQIIIDSSCTSLALTVRGNCTITDNGTTTVITQDGAVNRTNINEECDIALVDALVDDIAKLTGNKVTKVGNIITIYEANEIDTWRQYDLSDGGRVEV